MRKIIFILKYSFIVVVAVVGIGIAGGVPFQKTNKKENEVEIELVEELSEEKQDEDLKLTIKQ